MDFDPRLIVVTVDGAPSAWLDLNAARLIPLIGGGEGDTPPPPPEPPAPPVATVTAADLEAAKAAASAEAQAALLKQLGVENADDAAAAVKAWQEHQDAQRSDLEKAQAAAAEAAARAAAAEQTVQQYQRREQLQAAIGDPRFVPVLEAALAGQDLTAESVKAAVDAVKAQFPESFPVTDGTPPPAPTTFGLPSVGAASRPTSQPIPAPKDALTRGREAFERRHGKKTATTS